MSIRDQLSQQAQDAEEMPIEQLEKLPFTLDQLAKYPSEEVWVVNTSNIVSGAFLSKIVIPVPPERGDNIDMRVENTSIPLDLCEQASKDDILRAPMFRRAINQLQIKLMHPRVAQHLRALPENQREWQRILSEKAARGKANANEQTAAPVQTQASIAARAAANAPPGITISASPPGSGISSLPPGMTAPPGSPGANSNPAKVAAELGIEVQAQPLIVSIMTTDDRSEDDKLSILYNNKNVLTKADLNYIFANSGNSPKLKQFAVDNLPAFG